MTLEAALEVRIDETPALRDRFQSVGWSLRLQGLPALVLQIVADPRPQHMKGFQRTRATQVQADIYAETAAEAIELRELCITHLVPASRVGAVSFARASVDNVRQGSEPQQSGERQRYRGDLSRQSIDFTFNHNAGS